MNAMSMWTYISSWLTPASIFLLLNLVVATIFIVSRSSTERRPQPPLVRSPSLVDRVLSVNFSSHKFEQPVPGYGENPNPLARAPSLLERVKSVKFPSFSRSDPIGETREVNPHAGSDSNLIPDAPLSSFRPDPEKQEFSKETDFDENLNPAIKESEEELVNDEKKAGRERVEKRSLAMAKVEKTVSFRYEGVDAKADDFINKFKKQLRLQRLDSLLRYREMLKRK